MTAQPALSRALAAQLGARALRRLARELAFDANRFARLRALDGVAFQAHSERAKFLAAARLLSELADELASAERAEALKRQTRRLQ
ncbi:MAG: hypothetical protein IT318_17325 [Anaerolineales bacterium]|nr:hypothetical protein [Anaerolineales bacterium]